MNKEELIQHKTHYNKVLSELKEINSNQDNERLRRIEVDSVLGGYTFYLEKHGFSEHEITKIIENIKGEIQ